MILDLARLLLFPALMAFAASSDLFTMTISNKVSLALVAGFLVMALVVGLSPAEIGMHLAPAAPLRAVAFVFFPRGWGRGGAPKRADAPSAGFGLHHW